MTSTLDALKIIVGKRWTIILAIFMVELVAIVVVSSSSFFPSELAAYQKQYNSTAAILNQSAPGQVAGIFSNNFRVAVIEIIPAFGVAILGLSIYETARIVEVIGITSGRPLAEALANLFILPSTWLELPAYAIAATESMYLVYSVYLGFKSGWAKFVRELRFLLVNVLLIAGVLTVAAVFEVAEIQLENGPAPILALLTWLPFVVVFAGAVKFWRRARDEAPALEIRDAMETTPQGRPQAARGGFRYCTNCGSPLVYGARFCTNCGSPVRSPPYPG